MAKTAYFFAGANSGGGFRNLFPEIADPETARDFIILKGGPGSGKNTFLRALGSAMEEAGEDVEYLLCSGDPASLDAVVVPGLGCAAADGTSPHVLEPVYPAAADRVLDLGRYYDITAAKARAGEIRFHARAYRGAYQRAYAALRAARQVELDARAGVSFPYERAERRFRNIAARELRRRTLRPDSAAGAAGSISAGSGKGAARGKTIRRFLGSFTHQGAIWRFDSVASLCPRVYEIRDSFGFAPPLLALLRRTAVERGYDVIACLSPENPEETEHLLIPARGLAFITTRPGMEYTEGKPFRRIHLDALAEVGNRASARLEWKMAALLREEAVARLREAKVCHDALEAVYNPYVDFDGVRAEAALECGRWLSWIKR